MKISVVIPAYNAACFLPRCIESVHAQTLQPAEIIVVDDGSTDETATVAAESGAFVVKRSRGGVSEARNAGIQFASSEWIALLDADDSWAPEKLELQSAAIRPDTVLVYTGIRIFDDNKVRGDFPAVDVSSATKMLRYRNPITPSTVLARRENLLLDGGFRKELSACEDWEMWVRLERQGQFQALTNPLTNYYVYPDSLSANPSKMLSALDLMIDTTLLADLSGIRRWTWRRRILASQLCSAGLIARENSLKDELRYMFRSLYTWPSPLWEPRRFAIFAVSFRNRPYQRKSVS